MAEILSWWEGSEENGRTGSSWTWRVQGVGLASEFPRSQSSRASVGCAGLVQAGRKATVTQINHFLQRWWAEKHNLKVDELQKQKTTSESASVSQEKESEAKVGTGSPQPDSWRLEHSLQYVFLQFDVWCEQEALGLYVHDFIRRAAATWLADYITVWKSTCTSVPNEEVSEGCFFCFFLKGWGGKKSTNQA